MQLLRIALLIALIGLGCAPHRMVKTPAPKPSPYPQTIRVALTTDAGTYRLTFSTPVQVQLEEATYVLDESIGELSLQLMPGYVVLKNDKRYFRLPQPVVLEFSPLHPRPIVQWQGKPYLGQLTLFADGAEVAAVMTLPIEEYVAAVLPAEMPSSKSDYLQALQAQAIAIRTYGLWHTQHPRHRWFDVYGDVWDQVMGPSGNEWQNQWVKTAVTATRGMVLGKNRSPFQLVRIQYHSTCGGMFEVVGDSLGATQVKADIREGEENCVISPLHRWVRILTVEQLVENLLREGLLPDATGKRLLNEGSRVALTVTERTVSGRAKVLHISLGDTALSVEGFTIRKVLRRSGSRALPSNYFFLFPDPKHSGQFYIFGAGFGHGRGLCQWGAIGQSLEGVGYEEILRFYYPNLQIGTILP